MSLTVTTYDAMLKEYYSSQMVENLVYKSNPLLALMPKDENFMGSPHKLPLIYGNPQGRSATAATAIANSSKTLNSVAFDVTHVRDMCAADIDGLLLETAQDKGAFLDSLTATMDGSLQAVSRSIASKIYGAVDGNIGQVNAEPAEAATTVITMKSAGDITNIEVGQILNIWSATSGGTQRNLDGSTTDMTVTAVNRAAGTVTVGTAYDSSGTIAADDYIFVKGDRGVSVSGLAGWIPISAPSATAFFGVDRTADSTRLGGVRYDGSSDSVKEALIEVTNRIAREGGRPDHVFISFKQYAVLEKSLDGQRRYDDVKVKGADFGFEALILNSPVGPLKVIPDLNCPDDQAWVLQLDTMKLLSPGKAISIVDRAGNVLQQSATDDAYQVRARFYGNVGCRAPGFNGTVTLAT